MGKTSKKAAPEGTSGESVQTKTAEAQEQPTTPPDGSTAGNAPAAAGVEASTTQSQAISATPDRPEKTLLDEIKIEA